MSAGVADGRAEAAEKMAETAEASALRAEARRLYPLSCVATCEARARLLAR